MIIHLIYKFNSKGKEIKIYLIPAHVGIEFNELMDISTKEAAVTGINVQLSLSIGDSTTMWRKNIFKKCWK